MQGQKTVKRDTEQPLISPRFTRWKEYFFLITTLMWLPDLTFRKAQAYQKPKFRSGDIFVGLKCGIFNFAFKWRGVIKCLAEKLLENDVTQIGSKDTQKQYEFIDIFRGSKFSYLIRSMSKCCKSQDTLRPDTEFSICIWREVYQLESPHRFWNLLFYRLCRDIQAFYLNLDFNYLTNPHRQTIPHVVFPRTITESLFCLKTDLVPEQKSEMA